MAPRFLPLLLALAAWPSTAQGPTSPREEDVWRAVSGFIDAIHQSDQAKITDYLGRDFRAFRPGGIGGSGEIIKRGALSWKSRSYLIRHVQLLDSDAALALGVWQDPSAKPPSDAGTFDFALVREQDRWKIAGIHG